MHYIYAKQKISVTIGYCLVRCCVDPFEQGHGRLDRSCRGLREHGIQWDVVRVDLTHLVQQFLEGALSRDLHASKDTQGRDPAVSYGDVQLQRHLERFQSLEKRLPEKPRCKIGAHCVRIMFSVLYSGLPWAQWFRRHHDDLEGVCMSTHGEPSASDLC